MKTYNKLVRDKIPDIIKAKGATCTYKMLSKVDYLRYAEAKLTEELQEYQQSHSVEELADLLEVIYAVAEAKGCPAEKLDSIREKKAAERGSFKKRIKLISVREDGNDG